jgi:hypothetical protein
MLFGLAYPDTLLLFAAGLAGAAVNAVAGGGTFITFPALLVTGVPAIVANASNAVAIWPGRLLAIAAYRRELARQLERSLWVGIVAVAGGVVGAWALLQSSDKGFLRTVPWLLLMASLLQLFDRPLQRYFSVGHVGGRPSRRLYVGLAAAIFLISAYGGFFGGGYGVILMPFLALSGVRDMQELNALKNLLVTLVTGVAVAIFAASGTIAWSGTLVMMAGALIGGYAGGALARRLPADLLRVVIIVFGFGLSAWYFWDVYLRPARA